MFFFLFQVFNIYTLLHDLFIKKALASLAIAIGGDPWGAFKGTDLRALRALKGP